MLSYTPQKCSISYRNKTAYPIAISMTPFKPGNATIIFKSLHFASISFSCFSLWLCCMKYHRKICVKTSSANHISKGCGCLCPGQSAVGTAVCKSSKKSGISPFLLGASCAQDQVLTFQSNPHQLHPDNLFKCLLPHSPL